SFSLFSLLSSGWRPLMISPSLVILLTFVIGIQTSTPRKFYNGWEQWEKNCNICKGFLREFFTEIGTDHSAVTVEEFRNHRKTVCSDDNNDCTRLNTLYEKEMVDKIKTTPIGNWDGICESLDVCPNRTQRSMYDTPEFPLLRLGEHSKKRFEAMVESQYRLEF
ncbi:hypothetical protein PFISCL1PPCAC_28353, partial [Pristionchus fissidentatus]